MPGVPSLSSPLQWLPSSPEIRIHKAKPLTLSRSDIKHHSLHRHVDGLIFLGSRKRSCEEEAKRPALPARVRKTSSHHRLCREQWLKSQSSLPYTSPQRASPTCSVMTTYKNLKKLQSITTSQWPIPYFF